MQFKKVLRFSKADYKDHFDDDDFIYLALVSHTGGDVNIRIQFSDGRGGFGVQDTIILADEVDEETRKASDETFVVNQLAQWFVANMHLLSEWKFTKAGGAPDMLAFNKGNTRNFYPEV